MLPVLDGRSWMGEANAYGTSYLIELYESRRHPGFYFYAIYCLADEFCEETRRPLKAASLQSVLNGLLQSHGLAVNDLTWREVPASELVVLADRVLAGE